MSRGWKRKKGSDSSGRTNSRWGGSSTSSKNREDEAYEKFANMIIKKLEGFDGKWEKPWFSAGIPSPKALYGRPYNGMNALMLSLMCDVEGYRIPVFGVCGRFNDLNFVTDKDGQRVPAVSPETGEKLPMVHIKAGEESFPVFFTKIDAVHRQTKETIPYDEYLNLSADEQKEYNTHFINRVFPVFAVEQTNLEEARPELFQKLLEEATPKKFVHEGEMFSFAPLDIMINEDRWVCPIRPKLGDKCCYDPFSDSITVPLKEQFKDGELFYGNLLHEMAHSTGHESRLGRLIPDSKPGDASRAREELVAELSRAVTCHRYNFDCHLRDDTVPYLKDWLKALHEEPKYIKNVLNDVKLATGMITLKIDQYNVNLDDEVKLDGHEVDGESFAVDDDGILEPSEHLAPDKKQGENESKEPNAPEEQHHARWHR